MTKRKSNSAEITHPKRIKISVTIDFVESEEIQKNPEKSFEDSEKESDFEDSSEDSFEDSEKESDFEDSSQN